MPKVVDVDERRTAVAVAAARIIAQSGLSAATMRNVAAEVGGTTGMLTHYFTDKRELLQFTLRISLERRRANTSGELDGDALDRLQAKLDDLLPIDEERHHHWLVTLAFSAEAGNDAVFAAEQRDAYREHRAVITKLVDEARDETLLATGVDVEREADRLIALANGIALQAIFDPLSWPAARQVELIGEAVGALRASPA